MAPPKPPQRGPTGFDGIGGNAAVAADPPPMDPTSDRPVPMHQVPVQQEAVPQKPVPPAAISMRLVGVVLRVVVAVLTLIAAIVMGTSMEPGISPLGYFTAVNAVACVYALASMAVNATSIGPSTVSLLITVGDVLMVSFLFSGIGSASAVSVYMKLGNEGADASIALSSLGVFTLLALVLISIFNFHRSSN